MLLLVKNIDVARYMESFSDRDVDTVIQFLEIFGCCRNLHKVLVKLRSESIDRARIEAERLRRMRPRGRSGPSRTETSEECKEDDEYDDLVPEPLVVGVCPKCGWALVGGPVPGCERNKTNRVFYEECTKHNCVYYAEVFHRPDIGKNKYEKIEGG